MCGGSPSGDAVTERVRRIREMLTNIETWNPFCHGTSTVFAEDIERRGLQPRECTTDDIPVCRPSVYKGKETSRPDRVYLSRVERGLDVCLGSAYGAIDVFGGDAIVFGVNIERGSEKRLDSDEDADEAIKESWAVEKCRDAFEHPLSPLAKGRIPGKLLSRVRESMKEEGPFSKSEVNEICEGLPRWALSLMFMQTMSHQGGVTPDQLSEPESVKSLEVGSLDYDEALFRLATSRGKRGVIP